MYATLGHDIPAGRDWVFEPKYDGMRVLADCTSRSVRLVTRNGKDKSAQFPEIVTALRGMARTLGRRVVLDGEVVARARRRARGGAAASSEFQQLQSRMHVRDREEIARLSATAPAALVVFDLLRDGRATVASRPWHERRERLETLFADGVEPSSKTIVLSETSSRGATMLARARRAGWEGIIAKRTSTPYRPGERSGDWLKLKLQFRAEFVVGGFTEPRKTRPYLGALLLGAYDERGRFVYVGNMGGGFSHDGLREMRALLDRIERRTSPFNDPPRPSEAVHWVAPKLIVEVKFAEWTSDRLLRQPIFLGLRADKVARDVTIEGVSVQRWGTGELKK